MRPEPGYWTRTINRRQALRGAAAGLAATAGLAVLGCGQGDGTAKREDDASITYVWQLPDESKDAVPGGTYRGLSTGDTGSFDPFTSGDFVTQTVAGVIYETLLGWESGPGLDPTLERNIEGRLALSFEAASDSSSFTFRMRPNVRFHDVAPVNGRAMEIEDWRQSLARFLALSPYRANLRTILDKDEYPDDRTMVLKLKAPYAPAARLFTSGTASFWVMPKESVDGPMDPRLQVIGTNYRQLDKFQPAITWDYKKHPQYWRTGKPLINRWQYPIIPEYAQRYAQFTVGNCMEWTPRRTDIILLRRDAPEAKMYRTDISGGYSKIYFGPHEYGTRPWGDERVRHALSMILDRTAMREYFANTAELEGAGLPVTSRWHTHVRADRTLFWLDPEKDELGPASAYLKHDIAEARKLMAAAGYPNGIDLPAYYTTPAVLGAEHPERVTITLDMWRKSGLVNVDATNLPYELAYREYYWRRNFLGVGVTPVNTAVDVDLELYQFFHSGGSLSLMNETDPKVDEMIEKQRVELDTDRRVAIIHEFQKYMLQKMHTIPWDGSSSGFTFKWPWLRNSVWPAWNEWLSPDTPRRDG
jgi:peptide/nickel transport system substrate-binding protein